MRGNLLSSFQSGVDPGSIPAHAGEPPGWRCSLYAARVYPRACGGTLGLNLEYVELTGLSPRMRGNLRSGLVFLGICGSIPAHAGEPPPRAPGTCRCRVYPRACGGTSDRSRSCSMISGLSPRMRGNQGRNRTRRVFQGSIPAHAGEPFSTRRVHLVVRVYPRACGGTSPLGPMGTEGWGLSPRMRGNRPEVHPGRGCRGSIPAHAGEPWVHETATRFTRVYPRACGGTISSSTPMASSRGLSPRMRGNHDSCLRDGAGFGSIPAHAGEPSAEVPAGRCKRVYPRACGGTRMLAVARPTPWGLSPRMRGNPERGTRSQAGYGSIPAHAGEPRREPPHANCDRVYPRACGGTANGLHVLYIERGLSPRMRGNPDQESHAAGGGGSIPAHAGEPSSPPRRMGTTGVYPRACGGTATIRW